MAYIADVGGGNQVDLTGKYAPYPVSWPVYPTTVETFETLDGASAPGMQIRQVSGVGDTDGRITWNVNSVPQSIVDALNTKYQTYPQPQVIASPDGSTEFLCTWLEFTPERKTKSIARYKLTIVLAVDENL